MRQLLIGLLAASLIPACGGGSGNPDAGGDGDGDSGNPIDASPDAPVADCMAASGTDLATELVTNQPIAPILVTHAHDDRLFVVEQTGRILIVENDMLLATPFLDISGQGEDRVIFNGERGLLGLAFHPQYQENGRFFVHYSGNDIGGDTRIAEYAVSAGNPNVASITEREILTVSQPFTNHNGGMIEFGPDGMLYIALGDGGDGFDPDGHGQNINDLLGTIVRIDVSNTAVPYEVPPDNPFVDAPGEDEIWSYGWRNPWRFSFDPASGDIWVGDVGQGCLEEISVQPAGQGGLNFGWATKEGTECTPPNNQCNFPANCGDTTGMTEPIIEYAHNGSEASVTGGYLYRGGCIPDVAGWYFFADYEDSEIYAIDTALSAPTRMTIPITGIGQPTSFGRDRYGELYITTVGGAGGIYRVIAAP